MPYIFFEDGGRYITVKTDNNKIIIRCDFDYTDCGMTEPLGKFTARHGGADETVKYLRDVYNKHTKI